ncbi:MAG TPA: GNAT family N-acetyltransferase [Fimbriimonadaceae bacterium]|jgi:GNAT superfamily N-acetyltransferase
MELDFKVVEAELEDAQKAAALFDAYRVHYGQKSNRAGSSKFLRERLERNEAKLILALNEANQPIGFALMYRRFASLRLSQGWIVNDVFVEPSSRRSGVATALIKEAIYVASASGAKTLLISTETSNTNSRSLYEGLGFAPLEGIALYALTLK